MIVRLSEMPHGTVLDPLLFLVMIALINKYITSSTLVSFAYDSRVYTNITQMESCDNLQSEEYCRPSFQPGIQKAWTLETVLNNDTK